MQLHIYQIFSLMMFLLLQIRNAKMDKEKIKVEDMKGENITNLFLNERTSFVKYSLKVSLQHITDLEG